MALTNKKLKETYKLVMGEELTGSGSSVKLDKSSVSNFITALGSEIINNMGEEKKLLGSLSHTLHFVTLLGLNSKRSVRRTDTGKTSCLTTVGVTLISDKAIKVPVINVTINKDTGINQSDISSRRVQKGTPFNLNMYEMMFLLIRKEYAGFMEYDGDPRGVVFSPKLAYFLKGESKLPTPALSFKYGQGSIKENMVAIDEKIGGRWQAKEEYAKDFGGLFVRKVTPRKSDDSSISTSTTVALALGEMLERKLKIEA
jgi:hypothetical protein